jgi:hypothetical protein
MRILKSAMIAALALALPGLASAAVVYDLTLTDAASPAFSGTGSLTLASAPTLSGVTNYSAAQVSALSFTIGGQTFNLTDPGVQLSTVQFVNGTLSDITFAEEIGASPDRFALHTTSGYAYYYNNELSAAYGTITARVAAAVPEPSTWGLMIVGLGLAGAAMRRRKALRQGEQATTVTA